VLLGAAGVAAAAVVGGCGGDDGGDDGGTTSTGGDTTTTAGSSSYSLVRFFNTEAVVAGIPQRLTFGLGDRDGVVVSDAPPSLAIQFVRLTSGSGGDTIGQPVLVPSSQGSLPRPYFAAPFTAPQPGNYAAVSEYEGEEISAAFSVAEQAGLPQVGQPMIPLDTPTVDDHRGVEPICTAEPPCALHDVTLRQALAAGEPVALLVSTPRFCQVSICGPVLDLLVAERDRYPAVRMLHAEVFVDLQAETTTETVQAYQLPFEPCLFVADATGTITARLDNIFDEAELTKALDAATV
jgi:hypothetical protein